MLTAAAMRARRVLAAVLACVGVALCGSSAAPSQVRISLGDASDELRVSWATELPTAASVVQYAPLAGRRRLRTSATASASSSAVAANATATDADARTATGVQWRFAASPTRSIMLHQARARSRLRVSRQRRAQRAFRSRAQPRFLQRSTAPPPPTQATLRGLQAGASYAYRVGGGDPFSWSPRFVLRAPRPRDDDIAPLRLLAFCDAGEVDGARTAALDAAALDAETGAYDALLHCGDFAYDLESDGGRTGDRFLSAMQPLTASLPYLVSPGNHEQAANFSAFRNRFAGMPGSAASESLYWSADIGPLHLVSYNTEVYFVRALVMDIALLPACANSRALSISLPQWPKHFGYEHAAQQHAWLAADLAAADANRDAVPWVVVTGHRPMYCVATGGDGRCDAEHEASRQGTMMECSAADGHVCWRRDAAKALPELSVEALMQQFGVDVAIFGHVHAYARHWPVFAEHTLASGPDAYTDPPGTVYFLTGAGGNPEMKLGDLPPPLGPCSAPWCAFQAGYAPRPGQGADYSYSRITVPNATHLRWEQVSGTLGDVIDDVWLVRSAGVPAFGAAAAARRR